MNEKTIKAIEARNDMQNKMSAPGYEFDADDITEQFSIIVDASCEDIIRQRQRLGGDWTVRKVKSYPSTKMNSCLYPHISGCFSNIFSSSKRYSTESVRQ